MPPPLHLVSLLRTSWWHLWQVWFLVSITFSLRPNDLFWFWLGKSLSMLKINFCYHNMRCLNNDIRNMSDFIYYGRVFINMTNGNGLSTLPCGTTLVKSFMMYHLCLKVSQVTNYLYARNEITLRVLCRSPWPSFETFTLVHQIATKGIWCYLYAWRSMGSIPTCRQEIKCHWDHYICHCGLLLKFNFLSYKLQQEGNMKYYLPACKELEMLVPEICIKVISYSKQDNNQKIDLLPGLLLENDLADLHAK